MLKLYLNASAAFFLSFYSHTTYSKTITQKDIHCLAEVIYYEARGESLTGKKAVANVVFNRKKHKRFPNTLCSVIYQKNQFSWTKKKYRVREHKAWNDSYDLAKQMVKEYREGKLHDHTHGSLFFSTGYHHKGTRKVARIGSHVFFKYK